MVRGLGVDVALEVVGAELAQAVHSAWRDAVSPEVRGTPITLRVAVGPATAGDVTGATLGEVLHYLSPVVTTRMIDRRAGELVMLHAAALADPVTGATAVLVAPSGTGKTTAAATLGRSMVYLSDETSAITAEGHVLPYRKPLSVIEGGHLKTQRSPSELGLLTTDTEARLAALLVIERRVDHEGEPRVDPLALVDALAALTPENSYLARLERPLHRLADLVDLAGGAHRVTYRESADLSPLLSRLLGARR
ncbi:hypothetical protein ASG94_13000 [Nocardioides sp. Soil805]|nr:hypothetical protein ASG94_13000 [Nocardioides sp. Soil805]